MRTILFIVGSLRKGSFNRQMAHAAEKAVGSRAEVRYLDFADLPYMNQDIEYPAPEAVARVRQTITEADGLWFFTPEYNASYPGLLKNLLDWLSRPLLPNNYATPTPVNGKPATLCGAAGKSAAMNSIGKLIPLLEMMKLDLMLEPLTSVALPPESWTSGDLVLNPEQEQSLQAQADAFLAKLG